MSAHTDKKHNFSTKNRTLLFLMLVAAICYAAFMSGCVPNPSPTPESRAENFIKENSAGAIDGRNLEAPKAESATPAQLPVRYQTPAYSISSSKSSIMDTGSEDVSIPVGIAPFSKEAKSLEYTYSKGPISLSRVLNKLLKGKKLSISWARDANRNAQVYVNIKPTDDLFETIDNILRQLDYSYELQGRTIIIKNKDTKRFHIAMPFIASTFSTGVGGNVLGSSGGNMTGTLNISSDANPFNIWENIETNLDKILEIWTTPDASSSSSASAADSASAASQSSTTTESASASTATAAASDTSSTTQESGSSAGPSNLSTGQGYYTIDRPIGMITVTAPRSLLAKIDEYLTSLKAELYRQVSIEAKIIEVTLTNDNTTGIDWTNLLNSTTGFGVTADLSKTGLIKTTNGTTAPGSFFTINSMNFNLLIDAMKTQGNVEILSNPRISVMNGQPAMISVGDNVTFISEVSSTTTDGVTTTSASTSSVMSGLGLGVVASVLDNEEIVLSITPVTSSLTLPIQYETFGVNKVGTPKVSLREINTIVRVKDGEMLVVGGLIDNATTDTNNYVAGLGEVPVAGQLFRKDGRVTSKKELVILLRPKIISL